MGIKNEIGVEIYETANFPTPVVTEDFKSKVINYEIGENIMILILENKEVWWSGIKIAYKPQKLMLESDV